MALEEKMKKKSNEQLFDIIILKSFKYDLNTINAAQNELIKRDIPNLQEIKEKIIRDNFKDLEQLRDDELIQYILKLKLEHKLSLKEIKQILFFGKVTNHRTEKLLHSISDIVNDDGEFSEFNKKELITGALWFFGGIIFTAISYTSASPAGTYVVTWGAILYGAMKINNSGIINLKEH
jgi:hypothetical protein